MIYRKLKDYIHTEHDIVTTTIVIFGDLMSIDCKFWYDGKTYQPCNGYNGEMDFLLEYYVVGIRPEYEIENNKIKPYLHITLRKDVEALDYTNPSEALEKFKRIEKLSICVDYEKDIFKDINELLPKSCNEIEQALIRAQEQEREYEKYNELEKRIGCPLEVFVATALGIYDKEKDKSK